METFDRSDPADPAEPEWDPSDPGRASEWAAWANATMSSLREQLGESRRRAGEEARRAASYRTAAAKSEDQARAAETMLRRRVEKAVETLDVGTDVKLRGMRVGWWTPSGRASDDVLPDEFDVPQDILPPTPRLVEPKDT
jgi:hypothetical protein